MDASVGVLHMLWDLRLFVTIFSLSTGPLKKSGWTTRLATVGKIPLLSLSSLVRRRAGRGPSPGARQWPGRSVAGSLPGAFRAGWKRRSRCPAGGAAAPRAASLLVLPRTECGRRRAAQGSGPTNSGRAHTHAAGRGRRHGVRSPGTGHAVRHPG